jgi:lysophospholipase L1-like esterase
MPESSALRAIYPPVAQTEFDELAQKLRLQVVDLRASMPDDLFYDRAHLNAQGRQRLSSELPLLLPGR